MSGWCCDLHALGYVGDRAVCCDPDDCGPCCENCPTCPTISRRREQRVRV